jgi:hypothetical protein
LSSLSVELLIYSDISSKENHLIMYGGTNENQGMGNRSSNKHTYEKTKNKCENYKGTDILLPEANASYINTNF